jgi:hypothetical protein
MSLNNALINYINDPYNPKKNYELGLVYYKISQTASAISFFLRCAEYSENVDLSYECLILIGKCLAKQNRRFGSEMGVYLHAINLSPTRPEAYFFLSLLHERKKEWLESYTNAQISETFSINAKQTITNLDYNKFYGAKFQKAVSAWWIGQSKLSEELFYNLADNNGHEMNELTKKAVLNNINYLKLYNHKHLIYNNSQHEKLKFKFNDSDKININFSQAMQDMFVLSMLNGKKRGFYVEIGAGDSFYGSNTALLDIYFNWSGISIEINTSYKENFIKQRSSILINEDATSINYSELFEKNGLSNEIDYLQLDCEPAEKTYLALTKIPFDKYKFAVITYEHDQYIVGSKYSELSRKFLLDKGYTLIVNDVAPDRLCSFEDWWVHPDLVDNDLIKNFNINNNKPKKPTDFMFS